MVRSRVFSFLLVKTGLYSLVYTGSYNRKMPEGVRSKAEHVRAMIERRVHREAALGFKRCMVADLKYLKSKFKSPRQRYFEADENVLINLAENKFNIQNHLAFAVSKRCPVFVDTTYLNHHGVSEAYNMCEIEANAPFFSFDIVSHWDDYTQNNLDVSLRSGGIVVAMNQRKDYQATAEFNTWFKKTFVSDLGRAFKNAYLVVCDKTSIDYETLEYLVKTRKKNNLIIIPMLTELGDKPEVWELDRQAKFKLIMGNLKK